jgi:acyl-CoA ligase (AMP-forming) (exosortase A-associated)
MSTLIHELVTTSALRTPDAPAIKHRKTILSYAQLAEAIARFGGALAGSGVARQDRVAAYLPKRPETVVTIFGANQAGAVFVPVNPLLKAPQVGHILRDCTVRVLVSTASRLGELREELAQCPGLQTLVVLDGEVPEAERLASKSYVAWAAFLAGPAGKPHRVIDADIASILYTSGSTGKPKGVVLSHKNMMTGAKSVAQYLENRPDDRLLAVLPLSFDYGFSQLSTAFHVGASVVLMDYLFARDAMKLVVDEKITGLAAVPPVWIQLAELEWPASVTEHLRYFTNSGGAMPTATLAKLRAAWPKTKPFLMYGLTEAFRATYLPPEEVDRRPESMGKAIPNTEVMVVRPDGTECDPDEPGELVQRGSLVALGYWNDPAKTAERFKPAPGQWQELPLTEMAVWSGDTVKKDKDGFLYFVGRKDEMIKTSGYRVSPTEVEEVAYASEMVGDAVAVGAPHPELGYGIVLVVSEPSPGLTATLSREAGEGRGEGLLTFMKSRLPNFMVPHHIAWLPELPRNPNGKFDRPALAAQFRDALQPAKADA